MMKLESVEARDLPDAWFQCVYQLLEIGTEYVIDRGSFQGQKRLEFDYVTIQSNTPDNDRFCPKFPQHWASPILWPMAISKNICPTS